jgi:hypothetical protein
VLWNDRDGLLVRLLEADGGMGPEIVIASGDGGAEVPLEATVAADPRGGFVVLGQVAGEPLVLRRLDAAARPAGPILFLSCDFRFARLTWSHLYVR